MAERLRADAGIPIGEIFAHISALYFRGKLTYARRFGRPYVITPDRGIVPAEFPVTADVLCRFAESEISPDNRSYREPLVETARTLAMQAGRRDDFVLLGSVASAKYTDVLEEVLGNRLLFPREFVGRGDMSRGGLLLRTAAAGEELEYIPVAGAVRRGARPPKLGPRPT